MSTVDYLFLSLPYFNRILFYRLLFEILDDSIPPTQYLLPSGEELDHVDVISHFTEDYVPLEGNTSQLSSEELERILRLSSVYSGILPLEPSIEEQAALQADLVHRFSLHLLTLRKKYFKGAFRQAAAAAAIDVSIPDSVLDVDDNQLLLSGSLLEVIAAKQAINKPNRFNAARCDKYFSEDPDYDKLMELATTGAIIDTDSKFIPQSTPEDFRQVEVECNKVIQYHASDAHSKQRGILVRMETLKATDQLSQLHFSSSHIVYKASDVFSRWCIDGSNRSDEAVPLNGGDAKDMSIARYQKTIFPTLLEMLVAADVVKTADGFPWSSYWWFKEDIKACFPQMDIHPPSALLLAMRITTSIVFLHLAGCFGWTGAPMAWCIIGMAMLRYVIVHLPTLIPLFLICDDFVGFGLKHHCVAASQLVRSVINGVCGPNSVSLDKSILGQEVEVIGWLVSLIYGTITPKYDAIDKMTYYFFSFDINKPQSLLLWQILHSFAERYSHGLRGMRPFVACFAHMIRKTGKGHHIATDASKLYVIKHQFAHKKEATASTKFAIEMWRLVCILLFHRKNWFAIPIEQYISMNGASTSAIQYRSVSDASPYRICTAFYSNDTNSLIGWSSVKLPFQKDDRNRYQTNREYLGLLLTLFLISNSLSSEVRSATGCPITVQWVNDNTGALSWNDKNKANSLPSAVANMAVSAYQVLTNVSLVGSVWIPGLTMGVIDHESRREEHLLAGDYDSSELDPRLFVDLENNPAVMSIVAMCNPHNAEHYAVDDYHEIFQSIYGYLRGIVINTSS
jgi:hypothetical protein